MLAHLRQKQKSVHTEEGLLQERLAAVEREASRAQQEVMAAKERCIKIECMQKLTMKDFSRVTEPTLVKEYQVLSANKLLTWLRFWLLTSVLSVVVPVVVPQYACQSACSFKEVRILTPASDLSRTNF